MSGKSFKQKDIAEKLGVSTVTVSNALNGNGGVSEEMREKILAMAEETGYTGNRAQRQGGRNLPAGILISGKYVSVGTSFYWEMYQSTAYSLSRRSILSSLEILTEMDEGAPLPRCLQEESVGGLIIIGRLNRPYMDRVMEKAGSRTVLMDCCYPEYDCSAVLSSNYVGMYRSAQYLVDHGHREIGFIGTPETSSNIAERYFGYRKCLADNHLVYHPEWFIRDRTIVDETPDIRLPDTLPTAFASSSDFAAGRVADSLKERGLSIPEDISVASYDDYLYDHPLGKILTTFHVDMDRMAEAAADLLVGKMTRKTASRVIYIDGHLTIRESVRNLAEIQKSTV